MKYLILLVSLALLGCQSFRDQPGAAANANIRDVSTKVDTADISRYPLASRASVRSFYDRLGEALHWSRNATLTPSGDSLMALIRDAHRLGLISEDYHQRELHTLLLDTVSLDRYSRIDVLLTDAYLTMYTHIQRGRLDPATLQRRDFSLAVDEDAIASLKDIHTSSLRGTLLKREPQSGQYTELKRLLAGFEDSGPFDSIRRDRASRIVLNMERHRWPKKNHDRYVTVNIPAFVLRVFEKDSLWLQTKVIVGKRETPTPVLESVIRSFIIYPYWHVPYSISTKEILPDLQKDATFLRRNNFEVLNRRGQVILPDTIQWDFYSVDYFPFVLRQREGSENSMGIIKFLFANNYGVYLHDTNSKRFFSRDKRDLSHGCVRVSNAVAFAHYLIREDDIYVSPEDLDQYLSLQQRLTIDLRKPIALRLEYLTAEVRNGVALFYEDIYKKDSVMMRALYPGPEVLPPTQAGL